MSHDGMVFSSSPHTNPTTVSSSEVQGTQPSTEESAATQGEVGCDWMNLKADFFAQALLKKQLDHGTTREVSLSSLSLSSSAVPVSPSLRLSPRPRTRSSCCRSGVPCSLPVPANDAAAAAGSLWSSVCVFRLLRKLLPRQYGIHCPSTYGPRSGRSIPRFTLPLPSCWVGGVPVRRRPPDPHACCSSTPPHDE